MTGYYDIKYMLDKSPAALRRLTPDDRFMYLTASVLGMYLSEHKKENDFLLCLLNSIVEEWCHDKGIEVSEPDK